MYQDQQIWDIELALIKQKGEHKVFLKQLNVALRILTNRIIELEAKVVILQLNLDEKQDKE